MQRHDQERFFRHGGRIAALARTTRERDAQNAVRHGIQLNQVCDEFLDLLGRVWHRNFQVIRGAHHALEMLRHSKRPPAHDACGLKQTVTIHEAAVVDRHHRLM